MEPSAVNNHDGAVGSKRPRTRSRASASPSDGSSAAEGCALTTTSEPAGNLVIRVANRARRRLLTRLRDTALPTTRETASPTRTSSAGGRSSMRADVPGGAHRWTTRCRPPARRPRRTACWNSLGTRIRCEAGSMPASSSRQGGATLATTGGQDGAASPGTHAQTEAVRLGATTIVWLERALTHCLLLLGYWSVPRGSRGQRQLRAVTSPLAPDHLTVVSRCR
jgi:hypothetical protein